MTFLLSYEGLPEQARASLIHQWKPGDLDHIPESFNGMTVTQAAKQLLAIRGVERVAYFCVGRGVPLLLAQDFEGRWHDVSSQRVIVRRAPSVDRAGAAA